MESRRSKKEMGSGVTSRYQAWGTRVNRRVHTEEKKQVSVSDTGMKCSQGKGKGCAEEGTRTQVWSSDKDLGKLEAGDSICPEWIPSTGVQQRPGKHIYKGVQGRDQKKPVREKGQSWCHKCQRS